MPRLKIENSNGRLLMDRFARYFVVCSLVYLLFGSTLGVSMVLFSKEWSGIEYYIIPSHAHLNLVGWVSMMIFGVLYHILPRFSGRSLYSQRLAWIHFWCSQIGLVGTVLFFFLNRLQEGRWRMGLMASGIFLFFSIVVFVFNMFKTLIAPAPRMEEQR